MNAKNKTCDQQVCSNADRVDANAYLLRLNDIRRTRLLALIQERTGGKVSKFADLLGYHRQQMHQLISPTYNEGRSIGEIAARLLEHRAGLQFGWLDQPLAEDAGKTSGIAEHDQRQLAEQRDAVNAAVRSSFVGTTNGGSTVPATAGTTLDLDPAQAGLKMYPGEIYVGVVPHDLGKAHLILLSGEARVVGADAAEEFATSIGGQLPTHSELEYICQRMPDRFKAGLYYTCDQEEYDGDTATLLWAHLIDESTSVTRVRAVRRVLAVPAPAINGITEKQVADLATRLIDQRSLGDSDDATHDELMADAGIKVGIGIMAMEIQKQIAGSVHQEGQPHA
jgi:hypothetical protein